MNIQVTYTHYTILNFSISTEGILPESRAEWEKGIHLKSVGTACDRA